VIVITPSAWVMIVCMAAILAAWWFLTELEHR